MNEIEWEGEGQKRREPICQSMQDGMHNIQHRGDVNSSGCGIQPTAEGNYLEYFAFEEQDWTRDRLFYSRAPGVSYGCYKRREQRNQGV